MVRLDGGEVRSWRPRPNDLEMGKKAGAWACNICKRPHPWSESWDYYSRLDGQPACCIECAQKKGWLW